jgi:hypothetical protein
MYHKKIDSVGKRYGNLLILAEISKPYVGTHPTRKTTLWLKCRCDCGYEFDAYKTNILRGKTTKCIYCSGTPIRVGQQYGDLTVLERDTTALRRFWCKCKCGNVASYKSFYLSNSPTLKCIKCKWPNHGRIVLSRKESGIKRGFDKHLEARERKLKITTNPNIQIIAFSHWEQGEKRRKSFYLYKCKCGKFFTARNDYTPQSCGCMRYKNMKKGEDSWNAKLTNKQAKAIRELYASGIGYTKRQIAEMFGESEYLIGDLINNPKRYLEE